MPGSSLRKVEVTDEVRHGYRAAVTPPRRAEEVRDAGDGIGIVNGAAEILQYRGDHGFSDGDATCQGDEKHLEIRGVKKGTAAGQAEVSLMK